jgi:hypothetical protein
MKRDEQSLEWKSAASQGFKLEEVGGRKELVHMEVTAHCIGLLSGLYRVQNLSFIFAAERGEEELKTLKLQLNASTRTRRVTGTDRKRKYRK